MPPSVPMQCSDGFEKTFYTSLHNAKLVDEDERNDVLRLPEGATWFGDSCIGRDMFVRPCYPALYDALAALAFAVLLGTPGIGKSTAVLYFIWRLLNERDVSRKPEVILYRSQDLNGGVLVFAGGTVSLVDAANCRRFPTTSAVLEIYDSVPPERVHTNRRVWLISSPRRAVWGGWQKQAMARRLYMPVFTLAELLRCRDVTSSDLRDVDVEELYERWGGSVRLTLKCPRDLDQRERINDALNVASFTDLATAVGVVASADDGGGGMYSDSHTLFHLAVDSEFNHCHPIFASDFTRDLVLSKLADRGRDAVVQFLAATASSPAFATLRGHPLWTSLPQRTVFAGARLAGN